MHNEPPPDRRTLNASPRLHFAAAACLPVRFGDYTCDLCKEACPAGAIALVDGQPMLNGECIGCGGCAAKCPTGAIEVEGFALPAMPADATEEIFLDCWRVPREESPSNALRVPCLGGLSAGWLVTLVERAGDRPIHLLDRGQCDQCAAGATIAELRTTVTEARTRLFQCGQALETLPSLSFLPSAQRLASAIPEACTEIRIGRRAFFRNLMGGVARGAEEMARSAHAEEDQIKLREPAQPVDHMRTVTSLAAIARRHGRELPGQVLPQISLGECSGHGICARVCPTGALQRSETVDHAELGFHAARCIACGQCARTCPDRAIRVQPEGGRSAYEVLSRWEAKTCESCEQIYYAAGGDTCPACRKNQQLMQGVAAMFGPRVS